MNVEVHAGPADDGDDEGEEDREVGAAHCGC